MTTLFALAITICMQGGECTTTTPEAYTDMVECVLEVKHQRETLFKHHEDRVWCLPVDEEADDKYIAGM